jgi:hypothetical protein
MLTRTDILAANLTSPIMLHELILQSLDKIIGESHKVIARDLPLKTGRHIMAVDSQGRPILVSIDISDGGRALLAGLEALETLSENRAWLYKLYPALFEEGDKNKRAFQIENIILVVVAPTLPPGQRYLRRVIHQLKLFTFLPLKIGDELGIYIEAHPSEATEQTTIERTLNRFRTGTTELNTREENYFESLNLP